MIHLRIENTRLGGGVMSFLVYRSTLFDEFCLKGILRQDFGKSAYTWCFFKMLSKTQKCSQTRMKNTFELFWRYFELVLLWFKNQLKMGSILQRGVFYACLSTLLAFCTFIDDFGILLIVCNKNSLILTHFWPNRVHFAPFLINLMRFGKIKRSQFSILRKTKCRVHFFRFFNNKKCA